MILAIDPGPTQSAALWWGGNAVKAAYIVPNACLLHTLREGSGGASEVVVEMVESFGMPVGKEVFETVFWIGRFIETWDRFGLSPWRRVTRKEVKMHLCGSMRAKDANIRQALIDKLGAPGTKKKPGGTYGIKKDLWSALAVAVTAAETHASEGAGT